MKTNDKTNKKLQDEINKLKDEVTKEFYLNGKKVEELVNITEKDDAYCVLYSNDNTARIISFANGYAITLPHKHDLKLDLFATIYRVRYLTDDYVLSLSMEHSNTYNEWKVYHDEWIMRYLTSEAAPDGKKDVDLYFDSNKLKYIEQPRYTYDLLNGYEVEIVTVEILEHENIEKPYYHIAVIKVKEDIKNFALLVLKSKTPMVKEFEKIIASVDFFDKYGALRKPDKFDLKVPEYLSKETKQYYEKLRNQDYIDWGIFIHSLQIDGCNDDAIETKTKRFENKENMDYTFDIMPTYTHIGPYDNPKSFPTKTALKFAGGNGFNGKPVLQFTLQFTTSNNVGLHGYTPMFDILRGKYDDYFRVLAKDMKAYEKPILFRVNNEMNSDWTSYCGQVTLLDPDIFVLTYERMARILKEEGCNNLLYIFNPTAKTYPFCSWSEDLCYLPSLEFVQIIGLTYYEYNNYLHGEDAISFKELYSWLYQKNSPMWQDYPAIISEFACGAGGVFSEGELYRNSDSQAKWVKDMFELFNSDKKEEFVKQIKGAVWFNADDYYNYQIKNLLVLDVEKNAKTINEFKKGLAKRKNK